MKQIMTSITSLDKCLFAETQNMQVLLKGLRDKKYKSNNFVPAFYSTGEKRSINIYIIICKQNCKKTSQPTDSKYTVK